MPEIEMVDYIVVGAGSAGCVIANRLSENAGETVALLEAGGKADKTVAKIPIGMIHAVRDPDLNWGYVSEPEPALNGRQILVPRGRGLGGSSLINGLFYFRGHPLDFEDWREMGCDGWGYADVLPYFKRAETSWRGAGPYHGDSGPLSVIPVNTRRLMPEPLKQSALAAGYGLCADYNSAEIEGFAPVEVTIDRDGQRASTSHAFLKPIAKQRPNLHIIANAFAHRILIENGRAVGVEYRDGDTVRQLRAAKEIILSAGVYGSAQLLLLSGIGPAAELSALGIPPLVDLPGVGRNLSEHPRLPVQYAVRKPITFLRELRFDRAAISFLQWALLGTGPFATQISNGHLVTKSRPDLDRPDLQMIFSPIRLDARIWFPGIVAEQEHCIFTNACLIKPKSRGHIALRSARPEDTPKIFFNIFDHPDDLAALKEGLRITRRVMNTEPLKSLLRTETIPGPAWQSESELEEACRAMTDITHHPVGTCRMGKGPEAVVDPQLRVIGVSGLRVADAAIMPTVPCANTNAAAIMIGEKAADIIRGRSLPAAPYQPARETVQAV